MKEENEQHVDPQNDSANVKSEDCDTDNVKIECQTDHGDHSNKTAIVDCAINIKLPTETDNQMIIKSEKEYIESEIIQNGIEHDSGSSA